MKKKTLKTLFATLIIVNVFFTVQVNALTLNEAKTKVNELTSTIEKIQNTDVDKALEESNYESLKNTDDIVKLLKQSKKNSKKSKTAIDNMNKSFKKAIELNNELVTITDLKEYKATVDEIEANIFAANKYLELAKNTSETGNLKYDQANELYNSLRNELEKQKDEANKIINETIDNVEVKIDVLNKHLIISKKIEKELQTAFNESEEAYNLAQASANAANNLLKNEVNNLKELVNENKEEKINELVKANTTLLASRALMDLSKVATDLQTFQINITNKKIDNLKKDEAILLEKLKPAAEKVTEKEEIVKSKENELNTLNKDLNEFGTSASYEKQIQFKKEEIQKLENSLINYEESVTTCNNYLANLNTAIDNKDGKTVVKSLLENEVDKYKGLNLTTNYKISFNNQFKLENFVNIENDNTTYSYVFKDGIASIYNLITIPEVEVSSIDSKFNLTAYKAIVNGETKDVISVGGITKFFIGINSYKLKFEDGAWQAYSKNWKLQDVKADFTIKVFKKSYVINETIPFITSTNAKTRCESISLGKDEINSQIVKLNNDIETLKTKKSEAVLKEQAIAEKLVELTTAKEELANAKTNFNDLKKITTNKKGQNLFDIQKEIIELNNTLNKAPSFKEAIKVAEISKDIASGNIDIKKLIEDMNSLNFGLNKKLEILNLANNLLEKNYSRNLENFKKLVGENYKEASEIAKKIADLTKDATKKNTIAGIQKIKFETVKKSKEEISNLSNSFEEKINFEKENLEKLNKALDNNNLNFLSNLEPKFKRAKKLLNNVNEKELSLKINEYTKPQIEEETLTNQPFVNNNFNVQNMNNETNIDEELEIEEDEEEEIDNEVIKEKNDKKDKKELKETSFLGNILNTIKKFNILWFLPFLLIFIIILLKRDNEEDEEEEI